MGLQEFGRCGNSCIDQTPSRKGSRHASVGQDVALGQLHRSSGLMSVGLMRAVSAAFSGKEAYLTTNLLEHPRSIAASYVMLMQPLKGATELTRRCRALVVGHAIASRELVHQWSDPYQLCINSPVHSSSEIIVCRQIPCGLVKN